MADRIQVKVVDIARQFEAHNYTGDDGYPTAAVFSPVCVDTVDGRQFFLPLGRQVRDEDGFVGYVARYDAEAVAAKVRRVGSIDPDLWVEVLPFDWDDLDPEREKEDAIFNEHFPS